MRTWETRRPRGRWMSAWHELQADKKLSGVLDQAEMPIVAGRLAHLRRRLLTTCAGELGSVPAQELYFELSKQSSPGG
jgi:hypothetical protein